MNYKHIAAMSSASVLLFTAMYQGLCVKKYSIGTQMVQKPFRMVLVSDLHGCGYGKKQRKLLDAIREQAPDALMMSGDIFDCKRRFFGTMEFLRGIRGKYRAFCVMGNHEYRSGFEKELKSLLESFGVTVLSGQRAVVAARNGQSIAVCGVDDPIGGIHRFKWELGRAFSQDDGALYTVLLSHRPELIEKYAAYPCDLVLSGHAHGGQWRVPYLLNGMFTTSEGFFPKYAGGEYFSGKTRMIVSRGMAKQPIMAVPRIFNRPELVVVDILPE